LELSWLRSAHIEAFAPNTAAHHAADWQHTRWRPAASRGLREVIHATAPEIAPREHLVADHERVRRHQHPTVTCRTD